MANPAQSSDASHQIPSLDGIRACAFGLVFLAHLGLHAYVPGRFGVTVFFFLSGYLITTLLTIEFDKRHTLSFWKFYLRRLLRIFPPFYLTLLFILVLHELSLITTSYTPAAVAALALHYGNYYMVVTENAGMPFGTIVYWSLAVEEHYYLLYPPLCLWLLRMHSAHRRSMVIVLLCAVVLLWRVALHFLLNAPPTYYWRTTDAQMDSLLFGCLLAFWRNPSLEKPAPPHRIRDSFLLIAGIGGLVFSLLYRPIWFQETLRYTLQGIALMPLFHLAVSRSDWWVMRPLNWRLMKHLGVLSYTLYLVHHAIIGAVNTQLNDPPWPVLGVISLVLAITFAEVMYITVERPLSKYRSRLANLQTRTV